MAIGRGSMTKELFGNRVGPAPRTPMPTTIGKAPVMMKTGGKMRGCGCAKRGTKGGKMV